MERNTKRLVEVRPRLMTCRRASVFGESSLSGGGRESSVGAAEAPSIESGIVKAKADRGEKTESGQEREGWNTVAAAKRELTVLDTSGEAQR